MRNPSESWCRRIVRPTRQLLTLLAAATSLAAVATESADRFALHLPIVAEAAAPYYRATVPLAAYLSSAHGDLRDLRVFNAAGQQVPIAVLAASGSTEEQTQRHSLRWFPLQGTATDAVAADDSALKVVVSQASNGTLVEINSRLAPPVEKTARTIRGYVLDASQIADRQSARALEIDWDQGASDFQLVDIESSDDLRHWTQLASGIQLARLDYNGSRIENRRIALPGFSERYLRLVWREPAQAPTLTDVQIEQSRMRYRSPPLTWSAPITGSPGEGFNAGEFRFHLDRPLPLSRLRIELPPGNQLLPVEILVPARERRSWHHVASGVAYRITSKGREWSNSEIGLFDQPLQDFVLRIDPRMAPPATPRIAYAVQPAEFVFLASGEAPYSLAVGNADSESAALPIDTLIPGFGRPGSPEIADASIDAAALPAPTPVTAAATEQGNRSWKKLVLWGVLVLGVAGMAAMAWQLLRQMKQTDGPR